MEKKQEIILITGGAGRLGRALAGELIKSGRQVRILVQKKEDALGIPSGSVPYEGDLGDEQALGKACKGVNVVIHLAAIVSQYRTGSKEILRTNTLGTKMVTDAAKKAGVRRILFASTVNVYGRVRKERLTEDSRPMPS